jgi:hypothetical protein
MRSAHSGRTDNPAGVVRQHTRHTDSPRSGEDFYWSRYFRADADKT